MVYRCWERVAKILAHEEADRIFYCVRDDYQGIRNLVDSMGLDNDHRAFCLEGGFAAVVIEPHVNDMLSLRAMYTFMLYGIYEEYIVSEKNLKSRS